MPADPHTQSLVVVTGATGFVAGHVIADLLASGRDVRATVRDPAVADVAHLREIAVAAGRALEIVDATLDGDAGWDAALDGATGVIHVAAPVPTRRPKRRDDVIGPAVAGTRRVIAAAARRHIGRVVVTSSIDAIRGGHDARDGRLRTADDWAVVERADAYAASKALAEREAWSLSAELDVELVTLQPGLILGPLQTARPGISVGLVQRLLNGQFPALPRLGFDVVDVRDVAAAHRAALDTGPAGGHRLPLVGHPMWLADIAEAIRRLAPDAARKVPRRSLPSRAVRLAARFDASLAPAVPLLDQPVAISSAPAERLIGWAPRPADATIADTVASLVAHRLVGAGARPAASAGRDHGPHGHSKR